MKDNVVCEEIKVFCSWNFKYNSMINFFLLVEILIVSRNKFKKIKNIIKF